MTNTFVYPQNSCSNQVKVCVIVEKHIASAIDRSVDQH